MKSYDSVAKVLQKGFVTQKEIQGITNLSQATVSRCIKKLDEILLELPHSSPKKYALPDNIFETNKPFGLVEVDEHGKETFFGNVYVINGGKYFVSLYKSTSGLYLGQAENGLFDGLPYFLDDLRPQGFLGIQTAEALAKTSKDYPKNLNRWTAKNIFQYLVEYGDDLPGNLKFGDGIFKRLKEPVYPISVDSYDSICEQIKQGRVPGSSAGGEQQKFTVFNKETNAHVLVKYTSNEGDAVARRWKDVLVTEYHALKILADFSIPAADVRLLDQDNRFYLEVKRFDRLGKFGRSSMFSLQAIDMEYTGLGENWHHVTTELISQELLSPADGVYVYLLWKFSQLIGNTDAHLGNISFGIRGNSFSLLPIYDMCSMVIAPKLNVLEKLSFDIPVTRGIEIDKDFKKVVIEMAKKFWLRVMADERISPEFADYLTTLNPIEKLAAIN